MSAPSKRTFADGAPSCSWVSASLLAVGVLTVVAVVFFSIEASKLSSSDSNYGLVVAAAVLTSLVCVCACGGGCRVWFEQPSNGAGAEPGPVSRWRLAAFFLASALILVSLIFALVALGSLGPTSHTLLIAGIVLVGVILLGAIVVAARASAE
jgi:hypothetical protein